VAIGVLVAALGTAVQARFMAMRPWRASPARPLEGVDARSFDRQAKLGGFAKVVRVAGVPRVATRRWRHKGAVRDGAVALVALAAIAWLQNIDVIVIGREDPRRAGAYAAISVSSKVLVFLALVVGGYLLPEAAHAWRGGAHALRQLAVSLILVGVPGALLATAAAMVPRWFLTVFFSARYVAAAGAFLPLVGAMMCLAAVVLITMYLLAVGDRTITVLLVAGGALATAAVAFAHGDPRATALADLAVQAVIAVLAATRLTTLHLGCRRAGLRGVGLRLRSATVQRAEAAELDMDGRL